MVIRVKGRVAAAKFKVAVHRATGDPIRIVGEAISAGEPILRRLVWMNDHDHQVRTIRAVVRAGIDHDVDLEVFEVLYDEEWERCDPERCRIDLELLDSLLNRD